MVTYLPLVAVAEAEQARRGEKKKTPASFPESGLSAVHRVQDRIDLRLVAIVIAEPIKQRPRIMGSIPAPLLLDREQVGVLADQVVARHDAAGEEMLRDPVGLIAMLECVRAMAMAEHVDDESSVGGEPAASTLQQRAPVGDMLEHLY